MNTCENYTSRLGEKIDSRQTSNRGLEEAGLAELMIRYQGADAHAVAELFSELRPRLERLFANSHVTRPYAEDLLQEFWIRFHKARHSYRPGAPVLPWVYAIARHTLIDSQRRLSRIPRFDEPSLEASPRVAARNVGLAIDLQRAITKLPAQQRKVFLLLKVSGLSLAEAALVMKSTVGATKQLSHRAYVTLRSVLDEVEGFRKGGLV